MTEATAAVRAGEGRAGRVGWLGRLGAPLLAVVVYLAMPAGAGHPARATAAIGVLMAVLWMTEALPLPATSLLPLALFPIAGVATMRQAAAPYAHPLIYLFMGGFLIALAMEKWGLHRRVALHVILAVGTKPARLVGGFMLASALLSMWISNTATTVMMLPIALATLRMVDAQATTPSDSGRNNLAVCLLLGLAYGASMGGIATPIGTPPNVIALGYLRDHLGMSISFARWTVTMTPLSAALLFCAWLLLTKLLFPLSAVSIEGGREIIRRELRALGPMSRGEWTVLVVFVLTALLWTLRAPLVEALWGSDPPAGVANLSDAGVAIIAGVSLFAIPIDAKRSVFALDWETARRLPWGVLLLFGGGLSLAWAVGASGLDEWIASAVAQAKGLPLLAIIVLTTLVVIFLTELTSNTATASTFTPLLGAAALGLGAAPAALLIPATLAASCAFMMPVATPPNAIVFGSGRLRISQMIKAGLWLNLLATALLILASQTLFVWLFGRMAAGAGELSP
ncbi:MAG: DASS family sodium-coupled anion symporter [Planctomycetota bacterium]|nr:MAG: DASS family sodium-coupled anion symporter [Planctomycetota bacterium]